MTSSLDSVEPTERKPTRTKAPAVRLVVCFLLLSIAMRAAEDDPAWVDAMRRIHAGFHGKSGTIARFGDSISVSRAFFAPLQEPHAGGDATTMSALAWIQSYLQPDCWKWQQDDVVEENGAKLRTTIDWPLAIDAHRPLRNIDYWLHRLDPEIAVVMWGSNDSLLPIGGFAGKLRAVVVAIKSNGTIPVLTTIPPRQGRVKETTRIAEMIREVARTEHVPLIDYQGAILARAPNGSWNGADVFQKGGANAQMYFSLLTLSEAK